MERTNSSRANKPTRMLKKCKSTAQLASVTPQSTARSSRPTATQTPRKMVKSASSISKLNINYLVKGLRRNELKFGIDIMDEKEMSELIATIPKYPLLKKVHLWGKHFENMALDPDLSFAFGCIGGSLPESPPVLRKRDRGPRHYQYPNPHDKSKTEIHTDPGTVCISRNSVQITRVLKSIEGILVNSSCLEEIRMVGLKINKGGWNTLARGLKGTAPVVYLSINFCKLTDKNLAVLAPSLRSLKTLKKLDLSNNELSDTFGFELARVISRHSENKDAVIWLHGLRGEQLESDNLNEGLEELCLANNKIRDKGLIDLLSSLYYDTWLRGLDLRRNSIGFRGYQEIISLLDSNHTLLYVDVRENAEQGPFNFTRVILSKIRQNIGLYNKEMCRVGKDWESKLYEIYDSIQPSTSDPSSPGTSESREIHVTFKKPTISELTPKSNSQNIYIDDYEGLTSRLVSSAESHPISPQVDTKQSTTESETPEESKESKLCIQCREYERALFKSESHCISLAMENCRLKKQLRQSAQPTRPVQTTQHQSWSNSAISQLDQQTYTSNQPESISITNMSVLST